MLSTARTILRILTPNDAEAIFKLRSNPEVNRYIKRDIPKNMDDVYAFIDRVSDRMYAGTSFYWTIRLQENEELIGAICLWNFSEDRKTAELGYELLPEYQGKGYMSEVIARILDHAFHTSGFTTIEAFTHRNNERSINLLKKFGFLLQPERRDEEVPHNVIFALTK